MVNQMVLLILVYKDLIISTIVDAEYGGITRE